MDFHEKASTHKIWNNFSSHMNAFRWAFQAEDGSEHPEVVTQCCAIKPLASWLLEEVVSVTRERCGGQGYLSANRSAYVCICTSYNIIKQELLSS